MRRLRRLAVGLSVVAVATACTTQQPKQPEQPTPAPPTASATQPSSPTVPPGTFEHPYATTSLWNSVPVNPKLGNYQIPDTPQAWLPQVNQKDYGVSVYLAKASDPPMELFPMPGSDGINDPDAETKHKSVQVPHFPAGVIPPSGSDGSVSIQDEASGIQYNFWQLHKAPDGRWHTSQVAWSEVGGPGFGDPSHYFQGAPAAGNPSMAGLIRKHEYEDANAKEYPHALSVTLDYSALAAGQNNGGGDWSGDYVWPATQGDGYGRKNTGKIPEGSRLMLPADYPVDALKSAQLRKVARTLQKYGAYVVDRNDGTPLTISASTDFEFELGDQPLHQDGRNAQQDWDAFMATGVPQQLDDIRKSLRQMTAQEGYRGSDGRVTNPTPGRDVNLMSLRGSWDLAGGSQLGEYNSFTKRLEFAQGGVNQLRADDWQRVKWAKLKPGEKVKITVSGGGGAKLDMIVNCGVKSETGSGGPLGDGQSAEFAWPSCADANTLLIAQSGAEPGSWLGVDLRRS